MVETMRHQVTTRGQGDVQDLTGLVGRILDGSSIDAGLATVAVVGSTAGITTIEFEPGAVAEARQAPLLRLVLRPELAQRLGETLVARGAGGVQMPPGIGEEDVVHEGERGRGPLDVDQNSADAGWQAVHRDGAGR